MGAQLLHVFIGVFAADTLLHFLGHSALLACEVALLSHSYQLATRAGSLFEHRVGEKDSGD